ncbi:MAG TPA: sialidase family protein, partial [Actinomycetota bacterium]|nr:sialidase family protein [Actinomycetota bacterium]
SPWTAGSRGFVPARPRLRTIQDRVRATTAFPDTAGVEAVTSSSIQGAPSIFRGWCAQPYLAISKDEGASWARIQVAGNGMPRSHDILAQFEHGAAVAVDAEGNVYYFWTARNRLPYLAISRDGGRSFSKPMMVGPPGLKEAWGPAIAVGDTGKIALAYVGSTTAPGGRAPDGVGPEYDYLVTWNGYITTSVDALSTNPQFFTTSVNRRSDPIMRGECGIFSCGVQVDFIEVVIGPDGVPWASMVDGCPPRKERCDSFAGFVGTVAGGPTLR